jgi:hypothetical protein
MDEALWSLLGGLFSAVVLAAFFWAAWGAVIQSIVLDMRENRERRRDKYMGRWSEGGPLTWEERDLKAALDNLKVENEALRLPKRGRTNG